MTSVNAESRGSMTSKNGCKTSGRISVLFFIISVMPVSHHVGVTVASPARGQNSERVERVFRGTIKSLLSHLAQLQLRGFAELAVLGCTSFGKVCWTHLGKIWVFWGDQEVEQETSGVVLNASFTARMVREVFCSCGQWGIPWRGTLRQELEWQDKDWWVQAERGI